MTDGEERECHVDLLRAQGRSLDLRVVFQLRKLQVSSMSIPCRALVTLLLLGFTIAAAAEHEHPPEHHGPAPAKLGDVAFDISCRAEVRAPFNRAVALVHSFWHDEA